MILLPIIADNGWSSEGCVLVETGDDNIVRCECTHLTHFGYLLVSKNDYRCDQGDRFMYNNNYTSDRTEFVCVHEV